MQCQTSDLPTHLLDSARALIPLLRSNSDRINEGRSLPIDIFGRMADEGLLGLMRPERFGGKELGSDVVLRVAAILAEGDGSAAWVYGILGSHDHLIGLYGEEVQRRYWSSPKPHCASSYIPTGRAKQAEGGYVLSGSWSFCSGIDHCDWIALGAVVPNVDGASAPDLFIFLLRTAQIQIVDDWNVMGLAGTGSKSVVVNDVFVPFDYALNNRHVQSGNTPGRESQINPLYRTSIWPLFGFSILAPAVGIAKGAYEFTASEVKARLASPDRLFESRKPATLMRLAEAGAHIDAAHLLYERGLAETHNRIMNEQPLSNELRGRNRRDQAFIAKLCRQALESLMGLTGGRGIREGNPVQRALRDLYAISAHPASSWDSAAISFGSVATGGPLTEPFC